jgi:glycosyltransferase involved in cell wall biosynthesis
VSKQLHFVIPGPLEQLTGGYIYDAHMVDGLRQLGWSVRVHNLEGRFPDVDAVGRRALVDGLASIPDGSRVLVDGLAMGGAPEPVEAHARRLRLIALVHHPLADETGLAEADRLRLAVTERRALAACAGVIVSSAFTARGLAAYGVPDDRVRVVIPGTEPASPAQGPPDGQAPVLLCVASLTPRKGHDVLVAALAQVRDLPWTCVCAGSPDRDPEHAARVRRLTAEAALSDRVRFIGEREGDALEELYRGASVFVLASHHEGYGMALADALARGLPVVSTTAGAIPFTVPADTGLLVPPGDATAFAGALRALLGPSGAETRARLSAAARRYAATLPTWKVSARSFASAIDELATETAT